MTPETADVVITAFLKEIGRLLDEAVQIAKVAEACADAGNSQKAVEIVMDTESLMFDANTLLNAATLVQHSFKPEQHDC
jgi:thiazole synthase ThiGH ThiG subunit